MIEAKIQSIGAQATEGKEPVLVLFGPQATPSIQQVAVIQEIEEGVIFDLHNQDKLTFGTSEYTIEKVGRLANQHLQELGHVTLYFQPAPAEETVGNVLYLTPYQVPTIETGMTIRYQV